MSLICPTCRQLQREHAALSEFLLQLLKGKSQAACCSRQCRLLISAHCMFMSVPAAALCCCGQVLSLSGTTSVAPLACLGRRLRTAAASSFCWHTIHLACAATRLTGLQHCYVHSTTSQPYSQLRVSCFCVQTYELTFAATCSHHTGHINMHHCYAHWNSEH
jgi:hypothetical protein